MRRSWTLLLGLWACTDCPDIANPTGTCETPSDGGHAGYSSSEPCSWVRDCNLQLQREYYRVYVDLEHPTRAFMVPRPDVPDVAIVGGLSCLPDGKRAMPEINQLALTEALAAEHCLHDLLRFRAAKVSDSGFDVTPTAMPDDVAEVCKRFPGDAAGALRSSCERCQVKSVLGHGFGGCPSIYVAIATEAEADLLAKRLNEIYGISK